MQDMNIQTPPYGFAKRHGVLLGELEEGQVKVFHHTQVPARVLIELRRYSRHPLKLQQVSMDEFNTLLSRSYDSKSEGAQAMMDDLGENLDL
jgi:general secretion pathway protein E